MKVSQKPPTKAELAKVANISVYDASGKAVPFSSLYHDPSDPDRRTMVIFVRHFLCGVSFSSHPTLPLDDPY